MSDISTHSTLPTNLVSYWELEESSGTRVDSHGSNDLTDNNTVLSATGIQGDGADFESSNSEYLSTSSGSGFVSGAGARSVSLWVKYETSPGTAEMSIISNGVFTTSQEFTIKTFTNNKIIVDTNGSALAVSSTLSWSTGTWYHIVVTYNGTTGTIYRDGSSVGTGTATLSTTSPEDFIIGGRNPASPYNFVDAVIDEVGYWSKALTSTEVTDLYNSGAGLPYSAGGGGGATFIPKVMMIT